MPCENQNEEYISVIREELQDKVSEDYIQRYVGKAEEIIGKDERYLNVVKPLRKTLYDVVNEEKRVVLDRQEQARQLSLRSWHKYYVNRIHHRYSYH